MKRFALVFMLVLVVAGVVAASASALRFDDGAPCPDNHPIFLCPSSAVGQPYSIQLVGAGGCGPALPYQYKILNGALPGGLSLSSSGVISGVPTGAGTSDFWVELSDENPPSQSWCRPETAQREFNITIQPGLRINQNSVPGATIGQAYSQTLTASDVSTLNPPSGPQVNATWSVHSGTLPPGVALSTGGVLSGTPTTEGSYQFVVQAVNGGTSDTETYTIVVRQPVVVAFTATPPKSEVGVPFEAALKASGGSGTYTWALAGGSLPTGVNFDTSTGQISGSPSVPGRFAFSVSATDSEGRVTTFDATLVVAPKLSFKTVTLKAAKVGKLYKATIKALGGVSPVKWKILGGKLPRGIRFEKSLGAFSGTPSTKLFLGKPKRVRSLKFRVAVQATDALGVSSKQTFVLVVNA